MKKGILLGLFLFAAAYLILSKCIKNSTKYIHMGPEGEQP